VLVVPPIVWGGRGPLRAMLAGCLILLWSPPLYFALLAWHHIYLLFPLLLLLIVGMMKIAVLRQQTAVTVSGVGHLPEGTQA